ncbi:MAG: SseB family protein, partial [Paracoccaceae bacterium]|nr:SseB family protein [Paracoccaceae bacterium]
MQAAGFDTAGPAGGDDSARLRYYERLADGLLFLLLEEEPQGSTLRPRVFALEDGPVVLAFDLEERLAEAAGAVVPYAALPGRVIAAQLAGQGVALGVNLGVAPSAFLVSPDAVDWLAATLGRTPAQVEARPRSFHAPKGLPPARIEALDAKLARAAGLAEAA